MKTLLYSIKTLDTKAETKESKDSKQLNSEVLYIEGYGSHIARDRVKDVVLPEAFERSLPTFKSNPIMLLNHDQEEPIGKWTDFKITEEGLYMKGFISKTKPEIQEMVKEGVLQTLSIGYNPINAHYDSQKDANIISELELLEVSVVSVPCNPAALFMESDSTELKNIDDYLTGYVLLEAISKQKTYNISKLLKIVSKELDLESDLLGNLHSQLQDKGNKMKDLETLVKKVMDQVSKAQEEVKTKNESNEVKEIESEKSEEVAQAKLDEKTAVDQLITLLTDISSKIDKLTVSQVEKEETVEESKDSEVEEEKKKDDEKAEHEDMDMEDEEEEKEREEEKEEKSEEEASETKGSEEEKENKDNTVSEEKELSELEKLELEALALECELLETEM